MTTKWYVLLDDGNVCGPFSEGQVKNGIRNGKIADSMRIRQGESGWIRGEKVRQLFDGLSAEGFYLRDSEKQVFGPFTELRLQAMQSRDRLPLVYWLRHGLSGKWQLVDRTQSISKPVSQCKTVGRTQLRGQAAGNRKTMAKPVIPPAPVMKLRGGTWGNVVAHARSRFEQLVMGDTLASN